MKTRYIFSSAILALTAISCTDLDVDIKSQYTELPDSEIATEAQLSNAFMDFVELLDVVLTKVYHVIPMNIQLLVLTVIT